MKKRKSKPRRNITRTINLRQKALVVATEPPIDRDLTHLDSSFKTKLVTVLAALTAVGKPFHFNEGYRTVDRQQWLYGSGRPDAKPYGRKGPILTNDDGVQKKSSHQGDGSAGTGRAADCYPVDSNGKIYIPKISDPIWKTYADAVVHEGLEAGYYWKNFKDAPHCGLPKTKQIVRVKGARLSRSKKPKKRRS